MLIRLHKRACDVIEEVVEGSMFSMQEKQTDISRVFAAFANVRGMPCMREGNLTFTDA